MTSELPASRMETEVAAAVDDGFPDMELEEEHSKKKCSCRACCMACCSSIKQFNYKTFFKAHWPRLLILAVLVLIIIYVIIDYAFLGYIKAALDAFIEWVQNNVAAGLFTYSAIYFVAVICFIPGSILTLGAGLSFVAAFGIGLGLVAAVSVVCVGASLGALVAFLLSRFIFKKAVEQYLVKKYKVMAAIDRAFLENGIKLNCLLRLSPIIPFSAFNYFMGATSCKFWHYAVALTCILPGTVMFCYIGAIPALVMMNADQEQMEAQRIAQIVTFTIGGVVTLVAVIWITCYAKKVLKRIVAEEEEKRVREEQDGQEDMMSENADENASEGKVVVQNNSTTAEANNNASDDMFGVVDDAVG